ncbi:hypothetical protein KCP77_04545 [Salmonella enterica subsp. enterica]|nr:hypothetical protein KCP77_04545 [Salmonella enterica subsp. enterica]
MGWITVSSSRTSSPVGVGQPTLKVDNLTAVGGNCITVRPSGLVVCAAQSPDKRSAIRQCLRRGWHLATIVFSNYPVFLFFFPRPCIPENRCGTSTNSRS